MKGKRVNRNEIKGQELHINYLSCPTYKCYCSSVAHLEMTGEFIHGVGVDSNKPSFAPSFEKKKT